MKKIFIIFSLLFVGACLGGYSPQSKFYDLHSVLQQTEIVSEKKISVGVNDVVLPAYLDKPQIVSFDVGNNQMKIDEFNRWGEPLLRHIRHMYYLFFASTTPYPDIIFSRLHCLYTTKPLKQLYHRQIYQILLSEHL